MGEMMQLVAEMETRPEIISASLMNGHCWADVPDIGVIAVVVTDNDAVLAQSEANELAGRFWDRRADFDFGTEAYPVDEAVEVAMAAPESTVFLSDSGDNPGAGGTTDVTAVLESLLAHRATNVVVGSIWDAAASAGGSASRWVGNWTRATASRLTSPAPFGSSATATPTGAVSVRPTV